MEGVEIAARPRPTDLAVAGRGARNAVRRAALNRLPEILQRPEAPSLVELEAVRLGLSVDRKSA